MSDWTDRDNADETLLRVAKEIYTISGGMKDEG
jgi:hypothetical protein